MKFILGTKEHMTQIFDEAGNVHPVTAISTGPLTVTEVKTADKHGYEAIQLGYGKRNAKNIKKPQKGQFKDASYKVVKEYRIKNGEKVDLKAGDTIDLASFKEGDTVTVSAISKGKGFQGVVKRHGFHGGPRSHGQKHSEREPGSISGGTRNGGRVPIGMRMAGRMGADRITVKNLKVAQINAQEGIILITGAVPGRKGTVVEIRG